MFYLNELNSFAIGVVGLLVFLVMAVVDNWFSCSLLSYLFGWSLFLLLLLLKFNLSSKESDRVSRGWSGRVFRKISCDFSIIFSMLPIDCFNYSIVFSACLSLIRALLITNPFYLSWLLC